MYMTILLTFTETPENYFILLIQKGARPKRINTVCIPEKYKRINKE